MLARDARESLSGRRVGDVDQMITGRTLDLPSRELNFTLEMLFAMRALEFEFVLCHALED